MNDQYRNYTEALKEFSGPVLFLDREKFQENLNWVKENAGTKNVRVATKSIRSVKLLKKILEAGSCFQGLMTYTLPESLWLRSQGFEDILLGYPTTDRGALKFLARDPQGIVLMVDRREHLELLEEIGKEHGCTFEICVDLDLSMDLPGVRFGVYRSHIHELKTLAGFLKQISRCPHLSLVGAMGYEAQIAGVMDKNSRLMKVLKTLSITQLKLRRQKMIDLIQAEGFSLKLINGGGTGSLKHTTLEPAVTEVTVGSAFFAPVLFDHYEDFRLSPALFFALPIVRRPGPNLFTVLGGGYVASGATDELKQPQPYLPRRLELLKNEAAGEVQTPLHYSGNLDLSIGDLVIFRHAKAGEICERFKAIQIIEQNRILEEVSTYRGDGECFL